MQLLAVGPRSGIRVLRYLSWFSKNMRIRYALSPWNWQATDNTLWAKIWTAANNTRSQRSFERKVRHHHKGNWGGRSLCPAPQRRSAEVSWWHDNPSGKCGSGKPAVDGTTPAATDTWLWYLRQFRIRPDAAGCIGGPAQHLYRWLLPGRVLSLLQL